MYERDLGSDDRMKNIKYHYRNNSKIQYKNRRFRDKIDTPNKHILNRSLSWLWTGTFMKSGGVKLVLWIQTFS
jgi:hypothetical protein